MSTLRDRIDWICRHLGTDDRPISARELARRANLSEPTIAMAFGRLKKNANASLKAKTLIGIANAGGVTPMWLATGDGPRDAPDITIGEFMSRYLGARGLAEEISSAPSRWQLSTVVRAISMAHRGELPDLGWRELLDQLQSGKFDALDPEDVERAEALARNLEAKLKPIPAQTSARKSARAR